MDVHLIQLDSVLVRYYSICETGIANEETNTTRTLTTLVVRKNYNPTILLDNVLNNALNWCLTRAKERNEVSNRISHTLNYAT